jgi:putative membrane protein
MDANPAARPCDDGLTSVHHPDLREVTAVFGAGEWLTLLLVTTAVLGYFGAAIRLWGQGIDWPLRRLVSWVAGCWCVAAALVGPLADQAHHDFAAHMAGHVLLGMLAPVLLVSAAPVTVALRALPVPRAKPVARVLASAPMAVLTHPLIATALNLGGLWLLYRTDVYSTMLARPWLGVVIYVHIFAAGYLFTFAILGGPDPAPHRASFPWRAGTLVAAIAAHNVLAKLVYAAPSPGVPAERAEAAGQFMYYGGAPVEIAMILLLCLSWSRRTTSGPLARQGFRRANGPNPT